MSDIDPSEFETPVLDLSRHAFDHVVGGFRVFGTWWRDPDASGRVIEEPCLALVPARANLRDCTPIIIPLSSAYLWAEETCDELEVAFTAIDYAAALGLNPANNRDVLAVIDVIRERMHDLINLPPPPSGILQPQAAFIGLAKTTLSSGKVIEKELGQDVP